MIVLKKFSLKGDYYGYQRANREQYTYRQSGVMISIIVDVVVYTITDASQTNQDYDELYLGLGYDNLYQELLNIGIKTVTITFKINMWRTADQDLIYLFLWLF